MAIQFGTINSPSRKLAQGNQYRIYANSELVVKAQRRINQKITRFPFPLNLPTASYRASDVISEKVLPFEIKPSCECSVAYFGAFPIKRNFQNAIVQERVPEDALLDQRMAKQVVLGNLPGLNAVLHGIIRFSEEVICRGLFLPDPVPSNFCMHGKEMKLLDCGMLQTDREQVVKVLTESDGYQKYIENFPIVLGFYFYSLMRATALSAERYERNLVALGSFKNELTELSRPERIADLWGSA